MREIIPIRENSYIPFRSTELYIIGKQLFNGTAKILYNESHCNTKEQLRRLHKLNESTVSVSTTTSNAPLDKS